MYGRALIAALLLTTVSGCGLWNQLNTRVEVSQLPLDALEVPAMVKLGQEVRVTLTVTTPGCEQFERGWVEFDESRRTATVFATKRLELRPNQACPADATPYKRSVVFTPQRAGTYQVESWDKRIVRTLEVGE